MYLHYTTYLSVCTYFLKNIFIYSSDAATKKYVDGSSAFTKKHIGTITKFNTPLMFEKEDAINARGLLVDFSSSITSSSSNQFVRLTEYSSGGYSDIPFTILNFFQNAGTIEFSGKSFLPKVCARHTTNLDVSLYFRTTNNADNAVLNLSEYDGFYIPGGIITTAQNLSCDLSWVM